MATMTLRVAGEADVPPCDEAGCLLCGGPGGAPSDPAGSTTVRREPVEAARALANVVVPALEAPIGHDAPVGRRYGVEELARAIDGLTRALDAGSEDDDTAAQELLRGDVRRALAVFRAARAHHRPVVLEV